MGDEITLKDLARMANLSANTISCALNNKPGVSPETRERVLRLADAYNYRPNMMARSMRGVKTKMIGVLVGDISDAFFVELLAGVEEVARKESMVIMVGNTSNDPRNEEAGLDMLLSYKCENIVITPSGSDAGILQKLRSAGVNYVIADRTFPDASKYNQVSIDNRQDAADAVQHLISCGHKRIAIFNQKSDIATERERTEGYLDALRANGISSREEYIRLIGDKTEIAAECAALMALTEPPTALFIAKDTLSMQIVTSFWGMKLGIPTDLSVVIYGCPEWSQAFRPYFDCMVRPVKEIGRIAAEIIMDNIRGGKEKRRTSCVRLHSVLMEQETVLKLD